MKTQATDVVKRVRRRYKSGYTMAEFGPAIFLVFVVLFFPMLTLASLGLRYTFAIIGCRETARVCARCAQFQADVIGPPLQKSVLNTAPVVCTGPIGYFSKFKCVNIISMTPSILSYNTTTNVQS